MYDSHLRAMVGLGTAGGLGTPTAWKFSVAGPAWRQVQPALGPAPGYPIGWAIYHADLGKVLYFNAIPPETWAWDGSRWQRWPSGTAPHGFWHSSEVYDPALKAVVLFGGGDDDGGTPTLKNQTWVLATTGWTRVG